MGLTKEQVMIEYVKCLQDTPYALRTYLQTYDNTVSKYVPLELFPDQISLLKDYEEHRKQQDEKSAVAKAKSDAAKEQDCVNAGVKLGHAAA